MRRSKIGEWVIDVFKRNVSILIAERRYDSCHQKRHRQEKQRNDSKEYAEIWYFGPKKVRKQIISECARLIKQGDLSEEEVDRLFVWWYPLAETEEDLALEEQENDEMYDQDLEAEDIEDSEDRPFAEGEE